MSQPSLAQALGNLEEDAAIQAVDQLAAGQAPHTILEELQAGMGIVGESVRIRGLLLV